MIRLLRDAGVATALVSERHPSALDHSSADWDAIEHSAAEADDGLSLARHRGAFAIDVQRGMRAVQRRLNAYNDTFVKDRAKGESMHAADGVHLNDLGQLAMAFAILKGLHAPRDVSSVHIDRAGKVVATGCRVSDVSVGASEVRFTRRDDGLPFNHGIFYVLNYRFVPVPEELNRYLLRIEGLPEGKYEVRTDDR